MTASPSIRQTNTVLFARWHAPAVTVITPRRDELAKFRNICNSLPKGRNCGWVAGVALQGKYYEMGRKDNCGGDTWRKGYRRSLSSREQTFVNVTAWIIRADWECPPKARHLLL